MPPIYDPEAVKFMWEELSAVGIRPLTAPEAVEEVLGKKQGTVLLVINSVCGCAAGGCRPGASLALQNDMIPDELVTVFAGVDTEATQRARQYLPYPPSSPNIVLFKNGQVVYALERAHIERMTAVDIANNLAAVFNKECSRKGPSIPKATFDTLENIEACGSSIPLFREN